MSVDALSARAPEPPSDAPVSPSAGAMWWVTRLSRLVDDDVAIRCGALWCDDDSADGSWRALPPATPMLWPPGTSLPRGVPELAARARSGGRVTRVSVPALVPTDSAANGADVAELLAVPLGGSTFGVLVLALDALDARHRDALVREVRERFRPSLRPVPPPMHVAPAGAASPPARDVRAPGPPAGEHASGPSAATRVRGSLDRAVMDAVACHGDARAVALAAVDTVATLLGCHRVSLGVGEGDDADLLAVSGESRPDARRATTRHLAAVVAEAARRGGGRLPTDEDSAASSDDLVAHRRLQAAEGGLPLLSVVHVSVGGERVVAVLERPVGEAFTSDEETLATSALGPALALTAELHVRERGVAAQARARLRWAIGVLVRGRATPRAGVVLFALAALAFASLVPLPYRVGGRVVVEASDRQVLVAPEAGHIRTAHARAGDTVAAGELLATLDDRELVLALESWRSEAAKNRAEQSRALAGRDRVELARLHADAIRIEAELGLVEARRARGEIRAPFAGVVLSGDPTRSLGAPVAAGDVLFEIGAGARALSIAVDERDIALVAAGAGARVRMAAAPRDVRVARLEPIVPVAVDEEGRQVFRVPAVLSDDGDVPSPGMQGIARIDAGRRTLASAWTRTLRERALLLAWRFGLVR